MPLDLTSQRALNLARPFVGKRPGEQPMRCWACASVLATHIGFDGHAALFCRKDKKYTRWTGAEDDDLSNARADRLCRQIPTLNMGRFDCSACGQALFFLSTGFLGTVYKRCRSCHLENDVQGVGRSRSPLATMEPDAFMAMMEARWEAVIKAHARRRAEVASGLRFDVFMRDGFRCRYCGVSADDGAILHADHVIPQSKGGPTTLENLVTACMACNLGKSNKILTSASPVL